MKSKQMTWGLGALLPVFAVALALVLAGLVGAPAYAAETNGAAFKAGSLQAMANDDDADDADDADDVGYGVKILNSAGLDSSYGIYGVPGEKMILKANAYSFPNDTPYETTNLKGVTFKWKVDAKLKAKTKGAKLTASKLPKKEGKYKVQVTAYDKNGKKLGSAKSSVVVKKKPGVKIALRVFGDKGPVVTKSNKVSKNAQIMLEMKNAKFGWDNNTKKSFYTLTVKNTKTGKTAIWDSKKGMFKKNAFFNGSSIAGGSVPTVMGRFTKAGTYKVTVAVYHSNKKIDSATRTLTVK